MPRNWHDRHAVNQMDDERERRFYRDIVADKKPYFMRYIYPDLMKQYRTYIRNTNCNAIREFRMTVQEMLELPYERLSERQRDFLRYYTVRMPVGMGDCVMNRICRRFEECFDGFARKASDRSQFDYTIMKSGVDYPYKQRLAIQKLYDDYNRRMQSYAVFSKIERIDSDEAAMSSFGIREDFRRSCEELCPNEYELCDILLDICYRRASTKRFAWTICGDTIIKNLLAKNGNEIEIPKADEYGDIQFCGERFSIVREQIGDVE